jgi:CBS domain-containing protein
LDRINRIEIGQLTSAPIVFSPSTPISKIIGSLKQMGEYEVFLEGKEKIGMITLRDILRVSNITKAKAETLAFYIPKLSPRTAVREAARIMMEYRIKALPIIDKNEIIGRVTAISIINAMKEVGSLNVKATDIMSPNLVFLNEGDLASKARQLMIRRRIDHLPIQVDNQLAGIITSSNLVFNMFQATDTIARSTIISEEQRKLEFPVKHIMDHDPLTCTPHDDITLIFDRMTKLKTSYSLVKLWEEVQGIVTYRDYMKLIVEQFEPSDIPIYIVGLPTDPFEAEMARSKVRRTVHLLKKSFPYIEEVRSIIKTFPDKNKIRRRYSVKTSIVTPKKIYHYSETGWELPVIFDSISDKLKKMLQKRQRVRSTQRVRNETV